MSSQEARKDCYSRTGIRNSRDPEPRSQVGDTKAGDPEAQARRYAEFARSHVSEAGGHERSFLPAVRRAIAELPRQLRCTTSSPQPAAKLCHGLSGKGRGFRTGDAGFLSAEQPLLRADVGRWLHSLAS